MLFLPTHPENEMTNLNNKLTADYQSGDIAEINGQRAIVQGTPTINGTQYTYTATIIATSQKVTFTQQG